MDETIKQLLNTGVVKFIYRKIDGTERQAIGTRNINIIEQYDATPNGNGVEKTGVVSYYDLDALGWRSFREDSIIFISIND